MDENDKDNDLKKKFLELDVEHGNAMIERFKSGMREAYANYTAMDKRMSNHNFITNGAGAIAVLGYLGSVNNQSSYQVSSTLLLFLIGVVFCGIESRCQLRFDKSFFESTSKILRKFVKNEITVYEAVKDELPSTRPISVANFFAWLSQFCFWGGCVLGICYIFPEATK